MFLRVDCRGTQAFFAYSVYMHFSRCGGVRTTESGAKQAQYYIGGCSLNGISHRPNRIFTQIQNLSYDLKRTIIELFTIWSFTGELGC